jgi:hypothetical protein
MSFDESKFTRMTELAKIKNIETKKEISEEKIKNKYRRIQS